MQRGLFALANWGIVFFYNPSVSFADTSPYTGEALGEVRPLCGELPAKLRFQKAPLCKGAPAERVGDCFFLLRHNPSVN